MRAALQEIVIEGPAGPIQAVLETPPQAHADAVAVLCHPHPLYHGTMNNKVVHTLARAVNTLGRQALRFNFRGVGESAGGSARQRMSSRSSTGRAIAGPQQSYGWAGSPSARSSRCAPPLSRRRPVL
jgi:hypothetical protein